MRSIETDARGAGARSSPWPSRRVPPRTPFLALLRYPLQSPSNSQPQLQRPSCRSPTPVRADRTSRFGRSAASVHARGVARPPEWRPDPGGRATLPRATGHHFLAGVVIPADWSNPRDVHSRAFRRRSGEERVAEVTEDRTPPLTPATLTMGGVDGSTRATDDDPRPFIPERRWMGARPGYAFKTGRDGLGYYRDAAHPDPDAWKRTWASLRRDETRARDARRDETRRARDDRRDASTHDPYDYKRPGARRDDRGRGSEHARKRGRSRSRSRSRDGGGRRRDRSRDRGRHHDRNRAGHERVDRRDEDREEGEVSGGGGGGGGGGTREEREAAALARLAARRGRSSRDIAIERRAW